MKRAILRATAAAALLLLLFTALALPRLGAWLVVEDPLAKADAIYVLGGTIYERPLEALDLYKAGWAPTIVLVQQVADWGEVWLNERGITVTNELEIQIELLEQLGVPRGVITSVKPMGSTADEADALLALMRERGWSSVIVVTSKQHTRRAGLSMRRVLRDEKKVSMRASRYDRSDVDRWWTDRSTFRFTLFETQRYVAYWLGIAD
ncbi:MAG: YdcF family protein [Acidobacteriota bacterium]|nr:YdcF family protein [Acidobacteriota bacterium]